MTEIQKFKQGQFIFLQTFQKYIKMRTILSMRISINTQSSLLNCTNNLTFKPVYYARSTKRNQNAKQPESSQQPSNENANNPQQNPNNINPKQPSNKGRLTGPKRLLQLLKAGSSSIIPFYLNNMIKNTRNPSLPYAEEKEEKKEEDEDQAKKWAQTLSSMDKKVSSKANQPMEQKQAPQFDYPLKSSFLYKQRLAKKYKILQSLKTTRKQSASYQIFSYLKDFNPKRLLKDPIQKNFVYRVGFYIMFLLAFIVVAGRNLAKNTPSPDDYSLKAADMSDSEIQQKINDIKEIKVRTNAHHSNYVTIVLNEERNLNIFEKIFEVIGFNVEKNKTLEFDTQNPNLILDGLEKIQQNKQHQDWVKIKPIDKQYTLYDALIDTLFLTTPFIGIAITYWIFRKVNPDAMLKGIASNKKNMKIQSTKDIKVRFKDVAGMENSKKQITEFVDFLKNSDKYVQMGAKIPKGALLTGPPGTGKTMLAKACAGQAGTSFFYVSGSEFVEMFVGLGASRVRQLFARARQEAPSIIFIDEIDAIGKKRETSRNQEKDSTLNQMLVEMDGFSTNQTVIVLAATNRKDILDSALTRPGRFDRIVEISLPEIKARQEIFLVHLAPLKVNPNRPLSDIAKRLAELTPGFSGADIANLCNEAAIIATRKKREFIEDADFEEASQRIMAGYIKKGLSNQKTKKRVAYHEAGHAVTGWYLKGGDPLVKLTIIPRSKGALGYAQYLPKTAHIRTKSELIDQISIMLGGTTSEQIFLGSMSSGNSDDLQKVYGIARRMITQFGMGARTYNMTLDEQTYVKKESEKLTNLMDEEMMEIVNEATKRARQIIEEKREIVEQLAKELLQKETINNEDILRIMGQRPVFG